MTKARSLWAGCALPAILAATVASLALTAPSAAVAQSCKAPGTGIAIDLKVDPGRVVYHSETRHNLSQLQANARGAVRLLGWHAVGFTSTSYEFRMNVRASAQPLARGRYCASLVSVDATLGFGNLDVYIDDRYARSSCAFRSILEHENTHVDIFRTTLARYAPRLRERLLQAADNLGAVTAATPGEGADHLRTRLMQQVEPLFAEMNRALDEANARLDTPENYIREQERCSDW